MEMVATIEGALAREFLGAHHEISLNGVALEMEASLALGASDEAGAVCGVAMLASDGEEVTILRWASEGESEWPLMDAVVAEASARRCTRVRGEFVANGRNEAMREFLAQFGFTMIGEDEASTLWILPVSAYEPMGL